MPGEAPRGRAARSSGFRNCALTNIVLLEPGEAVDSPRVIRTIGPNVMASVYYFYDEVHERGVEPPRFLRPHVEALLRARRGDAGRAPATSAPTRTTTPTCTRARRS